jgi:hypothetical protein
MAAATEQRLNSQWIPPTDAVAALEGQGWRFKRAERVQLAPAEQVQRAVQRLQRSADQSMPLPRQPRSLLERVLQRDFSRVRMQTTPLETLGVEAAARDNVVYLAREQATRLDRPENLALLGHELTHVAASGYAPVQRTRTASAGEMPMVSRMLAQGMPGQDAGASGSTVSAAGAVRPLLPPVIQRSLAGEEATAERVEHGLRTFLSRPPEATTETASLKRSRPTRSENPLVQRHLQRATPASRNAREQGPSLPRPPARQMSPTTLTMALSSAELKGFRGGEPTLSGVPSVSMDVAPRTPVIRRSPVENFEQTMNAAIPMDVSADQSLSQTDEAPVVQRAGDGTTAQAPSTEPKASDTKSASSESADDRVQDLTDSEIAVLADKVYPLIRRILRLERERQPR